MLTSNKHALIRRKRIASTALSQSEEKVIWVQSSISLFSTPPPPPPHTHRYKFKIKMNFCNGKLEHFYAIVFNIFSITIKLKVTCSCIPNYIPHASEIMFYKTVLFLVLRSSTSYVSKIIQLLKIHWKYYTLLSLTVDRSQNFIFWRTTALLITTWYWLKKLSDNRAKNGEILA